MLPETKITKKQVTRSMAVLPSFDAFFSSYSRKPEKGYSGTCIFTRRSVTVPVKAEEGISGLLPLDRKPEPSPDELIGGTLGPESIALNMQDVKTIDLEGRTTIVDLGLFVLINVYCPNETNEERLDFKLAFNAMLEARILNLIRLGREVIVLGDLNICRSPLDHCDPVRRMKDSSYANFGDHPARKWFNEFVAPSTGVMVDLGRHFYPDRKSMFTHWETRINARETNYGTRIDYILATPGLLPWVKTCEIQPQIIGSDHCPVIADFYESITKEDGTTEYLWDKVNIPGRSKDSNASPPEPPKLAAKFYPEFGAEQRLLSTFFGKKPAGTQPSTAAPPSTTARAATAEDRSTPIPIEVVPETGRPPPTGANELIPSPLVTSDIASTSSQSATPLPSLSTGPSSKISKQAVNGVPASPSIDLTLDQSDDDIEPAIASNGKRPKLEPKKSDKKPKGSSGTSSPLPAANGSGKSITKPKGKKGQQTIATFFKPPTPAPEVVPKAAKQSSKPFKDTSNSKKGKERTSEEFEEISEGEHTGPAVGQQKGEGLVVSDDDTAGDDIQEDDDLNKLKRRASKGSRASASADPQPSPHKRRKSRDVSAETSSGGDSDIQDVSLLATAWRWNCTHMIVCTFRSCKALPQRATNKPHQPGIRYFLPKWHHCVVCMASLARGGQ